MPVWRGDESRRAHGGGRRISVVLSLLIALLALFPTTTGNAVINRRVALVIGNGDYQHVPDLANPTNDAEAISAKLRHLDFEVVEAVNVGLEEMQEALRRFGLKTAGSDIGLVFYAGHGLQVAGENYLLPVDAEIREPADLQENGLQISDLHAQFAASKPRLAILILDACRDNPFAGIARSQGLASGAVANQGLAQVRNTAGILIAFAAAPGAVAADGRDGNSPFTTALLQWIDQPDLEIGLMFRRVRQTVMELTGGAQTPWVEESLLGEIFLKRSDPAAAEHIRMVSLDQALWDTIHKIEAPLERRAALEFYDRLLPESDFRDQARVEKAVFAGAALGSEEEVVRQGLVWLSIRDSSDPATFDSYLSRNPNSIFAGLARQRLALLRAAEQPSTVEEAPALIDLSEPSSLSLQVDEPQLSAPLETAAQDTTTVEVPSATPVEEAPLPQRPGVAGALPVTPGSKSQTALLGDAGQGTSLESPPVANGPEDIPVLVIGSAPSEVQPGPQETEAALGLDEGQRAAVQQMLARLGYYRGRIDADVGPGTRKAVSALQNEASLDETGFITQAVLRHLVTAAAGELLRTELSDAERSSIHAVAAIALRGAGSEPTVVKLSSLDRGDAVHAFWRDLADEFEALNPGVRIELEHIQAETYKARLLVMLGSEDPPDILHTWGGGHLSALADAGFLRDLTAEMADGWAMTFKPSALSNFKVGERIYGAPTLMSLTSFWYNKQLFQQAGVDASAIRTWDDLLMTVRQLKQAGITPIAAGGARRWPLQFYWGSLAQRIGGEAAFRNALTGAGAGFNDPVFVRAGELMQELVRLGPFQAGYSEMTDVDAEISFARGETAMVLAGNWATRRIGANWPGGWERSRQEIGRLDFPSVGASDGRVETYGGTDGWVINREAPDEAVEFLRVLVDTGVQIEMARKGFSIPSAAGADTALQDPLLREVAEQLTQSEHHQLFYDQALGPEAGEVVNDIALGLAQGSIDPVAAAAAVEAAWERFSPQRGIGEHRAGAPL